MKKRVKKFVTVLVIFFALRWVPTAEAQSLLYIRVNEAGFRPHDVKTTIAFGRERLPTEFRILDPMTRAVVFTGKATPVLGRWGEFEHHIELVFSALRNEGSYVIELGSTRSPQFFIGRSVQAEIPDHYANSCASSAVGIHIAALPSPVDTALHATHRGTSNSCYGESHRRCVHWLVLPPCAAKTSSAAE